MGENNRKRIDFAEKIPHTTVKITGKAIRWGLAIVGIYISVSMILLIVNTREEFILQIALWSQAGFWGFFMGYWGWMFADQITQSFFKLIKNRQ